MLFGRCIQHGKGNMNIFKWFFIALFLLLSGCATKQEKVKKDSVKKATLSIAENRKPLGKVGVITLIGDNLLCTHTGVTVFSNERQLYALPTDLNELLTQRIIARFAGFDTTLVPLNKQSMSIINTDVGVSRWSNIEFNNQQNVDTVLIFSGAFKYRSKDGYYKDENALHTYAEFFVYDVSSGDLLAESTHYQYNLFDAFSCTQSTFATTGTMYELIKMAGATSQEKLINEIFQPSKSN